ncbi:MAG: hypothetical protein KAJ19_02900 [Gammaproteobacteria bacterium]|nr:hypothetical protein [Gammaproteobacteria bacterium]
MSNDRIAEALINFKLALEEDDIEIDHICLINEDQGRTLVKNARKNDPLAPFLKEQDFIDLNRGIIKFTGIKICWPVRRPNR